LFDGFKYFEYNLEGMLKVINSIGIPVSNMEKAVTFYGETLGLKKKYDYSPDYVEFDCGGVGIGLEPGGEKGNKENKAYIMFLVDDIDETYQKLKEKGVFFTGEPTDTQWGGKIATFKDPDENILQLLKWSR
jgi:Predicted enzyme related to lactoylglutathione lyase